MVISHQQLSDQTLIKQFRSGDHLAFSELLGRYKDNLYATIFYLVKDKYIAEDLFQDTIMKALRHIRDDNYMEQGKFGPWILRIGHNSCIDYFRKTKRNVPVVLEGGLNLLDYIGEHTECHEMAIVKMEVKSSVQKMIERLPKEQREVVVSRIYGELSFKEIAEMTDVSINTALGRMRYALQNLRRMVAAENLTLPS